MGVTMPCPAQDGLIRQGDRGREAAELGCGDTPRASYAPSGGERGVRPLYCRTDAASEYRG